MWKEKKRKDGKTYYYNVITRKIHPYLRGGGLSKTMYHRRQVDEKHPYLRGGGLTVSRLMYPRRPAPVVPNEEPDLLQEAEDELDSLICHISETLIVDQPVSIDSIEDGDPSLNAAIRDLIGTDINPLIYSESAIRDWFTQLQSYGGENFIVPGRIVRPPQSVLILTPQPDRIRDTARFVERIIHTRYQGSGWDQLRVQCAGYLELIRENGNEVALVAQEEAHTYEIDRIERERARANALGDAPAIAFAIEEQEVREAQVIAREGAIEAHAIARVLEAEIAVEAVPEDCPICQEGMVGRVSVLECRHYLHTECSENLINAATGMPVCPLCRTVIRVIPPALADAPAPQVPVIAPVEARDPVLILREEEIRALRERASREQLAERERLAARARESGWEVLHEDDPFTTSPLRTASPPRDAHGGVDMFGNRLLPTAAPLIGYRRDIRDIRPPRAAPPRAAPRAVIFEPMRVLDDDALELERIRRVELSREEYERRRRTEGRASPPRTEREREAERLDTRREAEREREEYERRRRETEIERLRRVEVSRENYERNARRLEAERLEAERLEAERRTRAEAERREERARADAREVQRARDVSARFAERLATMRGAGTARIEPTERAPSSGLRREEPINAREVQRALDQRAIDQRALDQARRLAVAETPARAATLSVPAGRPNWFQGLPGTGVNWTAGGWMFVNGQWVAPGPWLTLADPEGVHCPYPAPTLPPPSIPPCVGIHLAGNWVWNTHTNGWQRLIDPSPNPSPDWPNWWQGPPEVNWTAGGWMFVNGQWVEPTNGWRTRRNPGGVNYEHPAPTLAPPLEPGDWFWNNDTIHESRWQRWPTVRRRRGR